MKRRYPIENGSVQHVYSKSIYKFRIFTSHPEFLRMKHMMRYYQYKNTPQPFSKFIERFDVRKNGFENALMTQSARWTKIVDIYAWCLIGSHIHVVCKQLQSDGVELFMGRSLNAYSKFFNLRHNRKGPLWEHRFGNTPINDLNHFQTTIDYVHNNPLKHQLVDRLELWQYSSFHEYAMTSPKNEHLVNIDDMNLRNPGGWVG